MSDLIPLPTLGGQPPNSITRPATFNADSDNLFGALPGVVAAYNANVPIFNGAAAEAVAAAATASNAASTASNAASTASNAASTASSAASTASSAATAASKLNLGDKSTPPTTDNQGQALRAGATYYDTTLNKWRVWSGSAWGDGISAVAGVTSINDESGAVSGFAKANAPTLTNPVLLLGGSAGNAGQVLVAFGGGAAPVWGSATASIPISNRTSNTILSASDKGSFVNITSGTYTQTLTAAATLGAGWWCYYGNSTSGSTITIDPNGAELIDGVTTGIIEPGRVLLIVCNGAGFDVVSVNSMPINKFFTSGGSWTCPLGVRAVEITLVGGGNGAVDAYREGSGGWTSIVTRAVTPSKSYTFTVGAGGAYQSAGGASQWFENAALVFSSNVQLSGGFLSNGYKNHDASSYSVGGPSFGGGMGYGRGGAPGGTGVSGIVILGYT